MEKNEEQTQSAFGENMGHIVILAVLAWLVISLLPETPLTVKGFAMFCVR